MSQGHHAPDQAAQLRRGWSTGACAAGAARAALVGLLTSTVPERITIELPQGRTPTFDITRAHISGDIATATIIKDAGDDPDVTHLAPITATLSWADPGAGIVFVAGDGVGTVTLPGLPLPVGEPAINPMPRQYIADNLHRELDDQGSTRPADLTVTVSVETGRELATKTWNPRLGIVGGISILGTTGVVIPYSCSAWLDSIRRGIDVALAAGITHVVGSVGDTSEATARQHLDLPDQAYLDMGDFVGAVLSYLRKCPTSRLTLAGGFAKMSKLAAGHLDLHSGRSQVDVGLLADRCVQLGAGDDVVAAMRQANTALAAYQLAEAAGIDLAADVACRAQHVAQERIGQGTVDVDVMVTSRDSRLLAWTSTPR